MHDEQWGEEQTDYLEEETGIQLVKLEDEEREVKVGGGRSRGRKISVGES